MNLISRILTALVIIPIFLIAIVQGGYVLTLLLGLIFALGLYEYAAMVFKTNSRCLFFAFLAVFAPFYEQQVGLVHFCETLGLLALSIGIYFVFQPSLTSEAWEKSLALFFAVPYLGLGLYSVFALRNGIAGTDGIAFVLVPIVATASNDTFAYFVGKSIGRHTLYERVSAKKTWEGLLGGALGCVIMPFAIYYLAILLDFRFVSALSVADILWITVPLIVLAPLGDLIESRLKRLYGVKDSGNILPGHGGVLDRIDALLLALPWTYAYVFLLRPML